MGLHRALVHASLWVVLGLGLASLVAKANPVQCEARCASDSNTQMEGCLQRCPEARDPSKASSSQSCAQRCKARFDSAFKACQGNCPDHENARSKKKPSRH